MVIIIPAVEGCDCDYLCAALDDDRSSTVCVCPPGWVLANDTYKCLLLETPQSSPTIKIIITLIAAVIIMSLIIGAFFVFLYNRYQQMNATKFRRKLPNGPDLQLSRLRDASDNMMTEYNPNYEFGGGTYTIRDLKDVPREQLRLVK
uniref:EGF-like domain-containing protein n=4 Tax=Clastoptera arizonana TaxID=38151 RepID=A0A1B6D783_9HEMI